MTQTPRWGEPDDPAAETRNDSPPPGQPGYNYPPPGQPGYNYPPPGQPGYNYPPPGQPWPTYRAARPQTPGGVPLRPLGLADILGGVFTIARKNPGATLGLYLLGSLVTVATVIVASLTIGVSAVPFSNATQASRTTTTTAFAIGFLLMLVVVVVVNAVTTGGVIAAMGRMMLGQKISTGEAIRRSRFGSMVAGTLILGGGGFIIFIAPTAVLHQFGLLITLPLMVWLGVTVSLTLPAIVLEQQNPFRALARSWQLVRNSYWRTFGILALTVAIVWALVMVMEVLMFMVAALTIFSTIAQHPNSPPTTISASPFIIAIVMAGLLYVIVVAIANVMVIGVIVLIYADMRMRKEGMDLVLSQAAQAGTLTGDEFALTSAAQGVGSGGFAGTGAPDGTGTPGYGTGTPGYGTGTPGTQPGGTPGWPPQEATGDSSAF